jgi:hypothetical protein
MRQCVHCIAVFCGGARAVCDCGHYRQPGATSIPSALNVESQGYGLPGLQTAYPFHPGELKMIRRWFKEYERRLAHGVGD